MPGKLITVIVLLGINVALNLATKSWISAGLGGVLIYSLVAGSHSARSIAIWLTVIGLGFLAYTVIEASSLVGFGNLPLLFWAVVAFGVIQAAFTVWALTREDVIAWMDERQGAGPRGAKKDNEPPRYV